MRKTFSQRQNPSSLRTMNRISESRKSGGTSQQFEEPSSVEEWDKWMINLNFPPMPDSAREILQKWGGRYFYLALGNLYISPARASEGEVDYFKAASEILRMPVYPVAEYEMNKMVVNQQGKIFAIFTLDEIYEFESFESFLHSEVELVEWKKVDFKNIEG